LVAKRRALNIVAAAAMALVSSGAAALGLGRVNVQSVLGEPLRAEIEVTSLNAEEASSLRVNLATPEAFKAAGVDFNSALVGAKITLSSRGSDRTPVLVLSSDRIVQEPFVDVIVDFAWATGRLTRSYTLLIDPPGRNVAAQPATAPVAPVFSAPPPAPPRAVAATPAPAPATQFTPAPVPGPAAQPAPGPAPVAQAPAAPPAPAARGARVAPPAASRPSRNARAAAPAPAVAATGEAASRGAETVQVHSGDTLTGIAVNHRQAGVSLEQMLVSLYRSNPQAFIDDNMNRMKSGVTLSVPPADAVAQVGADEARQVIQAQSADFAAYRQRLAMGVPAVRTEQGTRQASGKIEAQVHDQKTAAAPTPPEKLTLSHGTAKPGTVTSEQVVSKEAQRQAEAARVAELSRNVAELKKLAGSTPPAATPAPAPGLAAKPAAAPTLPAITVAKAPPPAPPAPAVAATPAPKPALGASTSAAVPAPAVATASAAAPLAAAPALASAPATPAALVASAPLPQAASLAPSAAASRPRMAPVPQPIEEESFLSTLTDKPYVVPGLGAIVALLAGLAFWRRRQKARKKFSGETSFMESKLQPDSFFGASGGQRVDTHDGASSSASSSLNYSLSQLDAIGDVDPVAEADVYLAYGRDLQAEEILKEAQRSDPDRLAIRTKLLEVYAKRADLRTFETQARQLHDLTHGHGEEWAKALELGQQVDPANPLYHEGADFIEATEPTPLQAIPEHDLPPHSAYAETAAPRNAFESTDLPLPLDDLMSEPDAPHPEFEHTPTERQGVDMLPATADEMRFEVSDFALDGPPSGLPSLPPAADDLHAEPAHGGAHAPGVMPFPARSAGEVAPTSYDIEPMPFPAPEHEPAYSAIHEPEPQSAHAPAEAPTHVPAFATAYEPQVADLPSIPAVAHTEEVTPSGMAPSIDFDFGDLSLDLETPGAKAPPETTSHGSEFSLSGTGGEAVPELELPSLDANEPMARKIELADEFRRIGDHEGARELLEEVLAKADGPLRSRAQTLLDALS
jgi:pilus assembly protein FimV